MKLLISFPWLMAICLSAVPCSHCQTNTTNTASAPVRPSNGDLRLVSNSGTTGGSSGRLEVYYNNRWGTVCQDRFGANDARVACRQLGFSTYSSYNNVGFFGTRRLLSSTPIWLDSLTCTGSESRLIDCPANPIGVHDCRHFEDITLTCITNVPGPIDHSDIETELQSLNSVRVVFTPPVDNNAPITGYSYINCQNTCDNPPSLVPVQAKLFGTRVYFEIHDLVPNSNYILTVNALNEAGTGPNDTMAVMYSSATAADGTPVITMDNLHTTTQLLVPWLLPSLATQTGIAVTQFNVSWRRAGDSVVNSTVVPYSGTVTDNPCHGITLSNLVPGQTYRIDIVAIYSTPILTSIPATVSRSTLVVVEPLLPANLAPVSPVNPSSPLTTLTVSWPEPNVDFLKQYLVILTFTPFISQVRRQAGMTVSVPANTTTLLIPNFSGGAEYTLAVDAELVPPGSDSFTIPVTPPAMFTAPDRPPTAPTNVTVVPNMVDPYHSLDVSWTLPSMPNGQLESCTIQVNLNTSVIVTREGAANPPTNHTLINRTPGTTYTFEVFCSNTFPGARVSGTGTTDLRGCSELPPLPDGSVSYSDGTFVNSVGTYQCDNGFQLMGNTTRTCTRDGTWTNSAPVCNVQPVPVIFCPAEVDSIWDIMWPDTKEQSIATQQCAQQSGSTPVIGNATRLCQSEGVWADPDLSNCHTVEIENIFQAVANLLQAGVVTEETIRQTLTLTTQLENIIKLSATPLLPTVLDITNQVVNVVLNVIERIDNDTEAVLKISQLVINTLNNVLDESNTQGWINLQTTSPGSQSVLASIERLGVLLAGTKTADKPPVRFSQSNIAISAKQYSNESAVQLEDLSFPQEADLQNFSSAGLIIPAEVRIPPGLLSERLQLQNNSETGVPVVFSLIRNIEMFLPSSTNTDDITNATGVSVVLSAQVGNGLVHSDVLERTPLLLNFTFNHNVSDSDSYHCVFWNFSQLNETGAWDISGVRTVENMSEGANTRVECASTHLTSFAVLVNVAGGLEDLPSGERTALNVVSYVGCGVSIVCLLIAVVFFLSHRKQLLEKVHLFIHLNLSISLLLAYLAFAIGIETGVGNMVGCIFVAALLHYLFLAVFCWMLCEGVMLYLMLVVVFSRLAKAWWFFLLLGYLTPLPIVAISVGIRWKYYVIEDVNGTMQFCWLSRDHGTIFGFVGPMIVIILINVVFIIIALRALVKNKLTQIKQMSLKDPKQKLTQSMEVGKSLLLATIVLLPILGLTWVFGLLAINMNTSWFAWLFTILNSLQGVAILFLHVIRSKKVRKGIQQYFRTHFISDNRKMHSTSSCKYGTGKNSKSESASPNQSYTLERIIFHEEKKNHSISFENPKLNPSSVVVEEVEKKYS